ncbi:K(+)-transporting ATPase subunit F [Paenilisteria weihenstephanensis]
MRNLGYFFYDGIIVKWEDFFMIAMLIVSILVLGYLVYALIHPEKF